MEFNSSPFSSIISELKVSRFSIIFSMQREICCKCNKLNMHLNVWIKCVHCMEIFNYATVWTQYSISVYTWRIDIVAPDWTEGDLSAPHLHCSSNTRTHPFSTPVSLLSLHCTGSLHQEVWKMRWALCGLKWRSVETVGVECRRAGEDRRGEAYKLLMNKLCSTC